MYSLFACVLIIDIYQIGHNTLKLFLKGTSKAMPWLADLVQSSESSLNTLPVQCLCEFLLMKHALNIKSKQIKPKVASRLQDLLIGNEATSKSSKELVKYFVSRWSSSDMVDRDISVDGLQSILLLQKCSRLSIGSDEQMEIDEMKMEKKYNKMMIIKDDTYAWLHEKLTALPYFEDLLPYLMKSLQKVSPHNLLNLDLKKTGSCSV